jgi:hypothetical protein
MCVECQWTIVFPFRLQRVRQRLCVGEGDALGYVPPIANLLVAVVIAGTEVAVALRSAKDFHARLVVNLTGHQMRNV